MPDLPHDHATNRLTLGEQVHIGTHEAVLSVWIPTAQRSTQYPFHPRFGWLDAMFEISLHRVPRGGDTAVDDEDGTIDFDDGEVPDGSDGAVEPFIDLPQLLTPDQQFCLLPWNLAEGLEWRDTNSDDVPADDWLAWLGNDAPALADSRLVFTQVTGTSLHLHWQARLQGTGTPFAFEGTVRIDPPYLYDDPGVDVTDKLLSLFGPQQMQGVRVLSLPGEPDDKKLRHEVWPAQP